MKLTIFKKLMLAEILAQSVAIYSLSLIMFGERSGLDGAQIGTLLSIFAVTTLVFELPTGVLADKLSRKWSMVVARLILAAGMLIWLLEPNFAGYAIGMVLMGISESMMSGALQAYLYESLGDNRKLYNKYNSRLWASMMTGWLVGTVIASITGPQYEVLLVFSVLLPLMSAAVSATLPTDRVEENQSTKSLELFSGALRHIRKSEGLIYAFFAIVTLKVLVDALIEYIPLYYRQAGAPTRLVPILFLIGNFITIFIFWHAHRLVTILKRREVITGISFIIIFIASRYLGTVPALIGIFLYVRFVRVLFVDLESEFQHMSINRYRATLGSMYSMASRLALALTYLVIGYFSKNSTVLTPLIVFASLMYAAHLLTFTLSNRYKASVSQ